jgi:hypothetical protein
MIEACRRAGLKREVHRLTLLVRCVGSGQAAWGRTQSLRFVRATSDRDENLHLLRLKCPLGACESQEGELEGRAARGDSASCMRALERMLLDRSWGSHQFPCS